jgi:hypothetical protein
MWTGYMWLRIGTRAGCCRHGNEHSGFKNSGTYLLASKKWLCLVELGSLEVLFVYRQPFPTPFPLDVSIA